MHFQFIDSKRFFLFWLTACLAITGGLTAGFCTWLVQVALVRSAAQQQMRGAAEVQATILAQDTFRRPNQAFWGIASSGQNWEGDANRLNIFSLANGRGQIGGGQETFEQETVQAILGPIIINEEVLASGSVNQFNGQANLGVVLRWSSDSNWYKVFIDGTRLVLLKRVNGVTAQLESMPFFAQNHTFYTLRFRAIGTTLLAKVWPSDAAEPGTWQIKQEDTDLLSGQGGLRVVLQGNTMITIPSFLETQVGASETA